MKREEREFLEDIEDAIEDWDYDIETYHENGSFCVDITIDEDDWGYNADEIWEKLNDVAQDWDAGIDYDCNTYYLVL